MILRISKYGPLPSLLPNFELSRVPIWSYISQSNNNFLKNDALSKDCKTTDFCNKQTLKQQATAELWVNERRHSFALYAWIWWMMDILCLRLMVNKIMGTWKKKLAAFAAEAKAVALLLLPLLVLLLLRWWCDGKQRLSQTERLGFFNGQNKRIWQKPYFFRWEKNPSFVKLIPTFLACLLLRFENLFKSIKN